MQKDIAVIFEARSGGYGFAINAPMPEGSSELERYERDANQSLVEFEEMVRGFVRELNSGESAMLQLV